MQFTLMYMDFNKVFAEVPWAVFVNKLEKCALDRITIRLTSVGK